MYTIAGSSNGTISYNYDATGNKLSKQVVETGATVNGQSTTITTTTTYVGGFIYQSLNYSSSVLSSLNYAYNLQFFNHEEGRVRAQYNNASSPNTPSGLVFDYFLQDHLGNTRAVITEEQETDPYAELSFEGTTQAAVANQNAVWDNSSGQSINVLNNRTSALPAAFAASPSTYGTYCGSITKSQGAIGAAKLIRVMAGDQVNASVEVTYSSATVDNSSASGLNTLVGSIATMIMNSGNVSSVMDGSAAASAIQTAQSNSSAVSGFFTTTWKETQNASTAPEAYLHILLFNDQFVFDNVNSMVYPLTSGALNAALPLTLNITIPKDGYAYIYFSNESNTTVFFDNFMLTHVRGPLLETNDYYPFGLTMAATSGTALKTPYALNRYRYNDKELQNQEFSNGSGLEEYDYGARFQDPQLGRWWVIDPLCQKVKDESPYAYAGNNPVRNIDPNGEVTISVSGEWLKTHHFNDWGAVLKFTGTLLNVARNVEGFMSKNSNLLGYMSKETGLNSKTITGDLKANNGPPTVILDHLTPGELHNDKNKTFTMAIEPFLNLDKVDKAKDPEEYKLQTFVAVMYILHEYTHYGDKVANNGQTTGEPGGMSDLPTSTLPATVQYPQAYSTERGSDIDEMILDNRMDTSPSAIPTYYTPEFYIDPKTRQRILKNDRYKNIAFQ